jgi:hypothetical protein
VKFPRAQFFVLEIPFYDLSNIKAHFGANETALDQTGEESHCIWQLAGIVGVFVEERPWGVVGVFGEGIIMSECIRSKLPLANGTGFSGRGKSTAKSRKQISWGEHRGGNQWRYIFCLDGCSSVP